MCALVPPLFPNFGWPSTADYESYYGGGDQFNNNTFLDFPVTENYAAAVHNHESLGDSVSSERNENHEIANNNNNSVVIKKLNHNASERERRKKINSLFSSLRSCLPPSDQSKKLSIPATVSRSLKYIPELQGEVKKLIKKKEELLVRLSGQRDIDQYKKPSLRPVTSYVSTVSATKLGDMEVMVQISSSKIHNFSISNVLCGLEKDGFVLVDVSSSRSQGERVFYTLHLQMVEKMNLDYYKMNCQELSERMLFLFEKCDNSFR